METEAIWAIWTFRFGQYLQREAGPLSRFLFKVPHYLITKVVAWTTGIHLFPRSRIGPGLYIGHYGGIWINPIATLGANCSISQGVTVGFAAQNQDVGPELGDRVWVGPNATITGRVRIGSGAVVGANSLVVANVPENGVAVGVPAKIISYTGSKKLVIIPDSST